MDRRGFLSGAVAASGVFAAKEAKANKDQIQDAQYVILELLGYKKMAGRMMQGPAGLIRFDAAVEGGFSTQFINPSSIYRATIVDEKTVRSVAKHIDPLPTIELEIPPRQHTLDYRDEYDDRPF